MSKGLKGYMKDFMDELQPFNHATIQPFNHSTIQ